MDASSSRLALRPPRRIFPLCGAMAVLGALLVTRTLPHPARWQLTAVVLALTVTLLDGTITDAGHLISLLCATPVGRTGAGRLVRGPRPATRCTTATRTVTRPPIPL